MAILMIQEFEGTADRYDEINSKMGTTDDPPEGLLVHTAQEAGGGKMRVVDVWESQDALDKFTNDRLMPAMTEVLGEPDPESATPPEIRELYNVIKP